jgi:hypothetical protein
MASGETATYDLPYPLASDPVNVHEDLQDLAEAIDAILPTLGLPYHTLEVVNNTGSTIAKASPVYISGFGTSKPQIAKCDANTSATFPVVGLVQAAITDGSDGVVLINGIFTGVNTSSYAAGDRLYVAAGGGLTNTKPASGGGVIGVVAKANASGIIVVGANKGNGTWGSLKDGLS